ncbi:MAG: MBL fold metallo-hydrolase [Clostridia bacterium]|nr:MBL fold metallo-hydrolase [Clostridia bacterium]
MEIKCLNIWMTNCYLVESEKAAIVIDPGFKREKVLNFLKENEGKERLILITHGHFDHIGGAEYLRNETGVKIGIGALDEPALRDNDLNCAVNFKRALNPFKADFVYNDGDTVTVGDIELKVMLCKGHTVGGVSYLSEGFVFTGDTLFKESVGRTDFKGGSFSELETSVKKLYTLPDETVVYAGHGESTTIGHEKQYNPFVKG